MKKFKTFFASRRNVAKGFLKMALFGVIISSSVFPTVALIPSSNISTSATNPLGVSLAHAATCADALAVGETVDNATPSVGDAITYTLVGAPAFTSPTRVSVTGILPAGLTYVSSTAVNGTYDSGTNTWSLGTLNGASVIELYVTATVNAGTEGQTITPAPAIVYGSNSCDDSSAAKAASITVQSAVTPTSTPVSADIGITKAIDLATSTFNVGDIVPYELNVTDHGPATSTGVVATDVLPSGLTFVNATATQGSYASSTGTWTIGTVPVGSNVTLYIGAKVNAGTASTTITNTGTVTEDASITDPNLANNSSSITITIQGAPVTPTSTPVVADIAIQKTADVTSTTEGATVHYTLTATDNGPATSTDVTATDVLPSGLTFVTANASQGSYASSTGTWTIGTLPASSTATLAIAATVNSGTAGATITNTGTITENASTTDPDLANNSSSVSIAVASSGGGTCSVAMALGETVSNPTPNVGDTVTYTLVGAPAFTAPTHVIVTELLPATYLTFVSASTSQGTYTSSTGAWDLGTLNGSSVVSLALNATVNAAAAGQAITTTPSIKYIQSGCTKSSAVNGATITVANPVTATTTADIAILKTADVATTTTGSTVHYTIAVTDNGPATSTGVVANDVLPSGLTFQNATASVGSYVSSTGAWTIGDISASSTATLVIAALVDSSAAGTTVTNTGVVTESPSSTDPDLANNSSSVSIAVASNGGGGGASTADLAIVKTVDATSTTTGSTLHYTITATNDGPDTATGVTATDTLPSGVSFVDATSSSGTAYSFGSGSWTIGTLAPNATATLAIAVTVNASAAGTTITNTAVIGASASTTDPNLANNSSSVSTTVAGGGGGAPTADISIVKTADNAYPNPGDVVHYTLTAANAGPDASDIDTANDLLPTGLSFVAATSSSGTAYDFGTGVWTIGTLAPNATATLAIAVTVNASAAGTTITNTATISQLSSITDPDPANNSSSVSIYVATTTPYADLAVVKTVDKATANVGDTLNYTIAVTNNGPATSTGVVATDTLPSGLTFQNATASVGSYASSTGAWTIGDMSVSSTATLTIAAIVNSGTAGSTITNTAIVMGNASTTDQNPANNSSTVSTVINSSGGGGCTSNCGGGGGGGGGISTAEIAIAKSVDNPTPLTGATIHYTVTVSALGPATSIGVMATDTLPSGVSFVSASTSIGTYNPTTGTWTIGDIDRGANAVLVITATVTAPSGTTITNTATVSESPTVNDQLTGNNTASATINVGGGGGGTVGVAGGGGGVVLGTSTSPGQVLGASTCGLYLSTYIHPVRKYLNNVDDVKKLQAFLDQSLGTNIPLTGYYGPMTTAAVNQFQVKYHTEILAPWVPLGLSDEFTPTSYVYQTTWRWINLIMCPSLNLPMPALQVDQGFTNYIYN